MNKIIETLKELCKTYKVKSLYAFGSVCTRNFTGKSDIDLLVDFQKLSIEDYADNYFDLANALEKALNRPVDLVTQNSLKNPYFIASINQNKMLIYGR